MSTPAQIDVDGPDFFDGMFNASQRHFGAPPLVAICDKRVVVPIERLSEAVRQETGEELTVSHARTVIEEGWIPELRDPSTGQVGFALYAPSRVGLFLELQRRGYSSRELKAIASFEERQIDDILTDEETPYLDDDLALLIQFAETEIANWSSGAASIRQDRSDDPPTNSLADNGDLQSKERIKNARHALQIWRSLQGKNLTEEQRKSLQRKAYRVRMTYDIVRVQMLNRLRAQVLTGFSPFLIFRSAQFDGDWRKPAILKGLEWRWSLDSPWGWENETPIRLPGMLLEGDRLVCLRTFGPTEYETAWRDYNLTEYFTVRAELLGERVCPQCLKPIAAGVHEARRYCSDTCKTNAKMRRYRRRFL